MLEVNNLSKKYNKKSVISNINLKIDKPGLYIISGGNGSGKSTILKIIGKMIYKTTGSIKSSSISYLPDKFSMPYLMGTRTYLKMILGKDFDVDSLMKEYSLDNKLIGSLSKGNLQKLGIIQGLYNNFDIYLLDEPIDGLDDASKRIFKRKLIDRIDEGKIIIMALHNKSLFNDLHPTIYNLKEGSLNERKKAPAQAI